MTKSTASSSGQKPGKATGPRTMEGRARASQNARKHGLTSAQSEAACVQMMEEMISAHFAPQRCDPAALHCLADAEVRIGRIHHLEQAQEDEWAKLRIAEPMVSHEDDASREAILANVLDQMRCLSRYHAEAEAQRRKAQKAVIASFSLSNRHEG
ncbi:hypothetical protein OE699_02130 [Sedimentimonas flavescens]|uniref:Uncharacterized protein n=1 Tax=Sedimentimonas flavescens TaxID=2851012 RepID=A0ABT2ZV61_9RHOB|nr:hypothetical protein [Sedimentimonas flavescens]MCV2877638.1 hypothetical protein [Sedimentimonas flavescens]